MFFYIIYINIPNNIMCVRLDYDYNITILKTLI